MMKIEDADRKQKYFIFQLTNIYSYSNLSAVNKNHQKNSEKTTQATLLWKSVWKALTMYRSINGEAMGKL